jgi:hypothetical protein
MSLWAIARKIGFSDEEFERDPTPDAFLRLVKLHFPPKQPQQTQTTTSPASPKVKKWVTRRGTSRLMEQFLSANAALPIEKFCEWADQEHHPVPVEYRLYPDSSHPRNTWTGALRGRYSGKLVGLYNSVKKRMRDEGLLD